MRSELTHHERQFDFDLDAGGFRLGAVDALGANSSAAAIDAVWRLSIYAVKTFSKVV